VDDTVMLLQHIELMSIVYTLNTYFVMHWSIELIREYLVNVLMQYTKLATCFTMFTYFSRPCN